jgi:ABC-2 type transport system ATP-binding protein
LIYDLAQRGVTIFVTTHYMDEAEHCHRVGIMFRGQLLALDTPGDLKRSALPGAAWDVTPDHGAESLVPGGLHDVRGARGPLPIAGRSLRRITRASAALGS